MHHYLTPKQEEKFWNRVIRSDDESCWLWVGNIAVTGYGRYGQELAHRIAYEIVNGPIPDGMLACHTCDHPWCVNPAHIYAGTHADNTRDMIERNNNECLVKNKMTFGERNGKSKLNADLVRQIRREKADGMRAASLATKYGVAKSTIYYVLNGEVWTHVK